MRAGAFGRPPFLWRAERLCARGCLRGTRTPPKVPEASPHGTDPDTAAGPYLHTNRSKGFGHAKEVAVRSIRLAVASAVVAFAGFGLALPAHAEPNEGRYHECANALLWA